MGMKTTATLSEDGKHYIVTGTKKWITNGNDSILATCCFDPSSLGTFCDYFTVGCRTEVSNRPVASQVKWKLIFGPVRIFCFSH